MGLKPPIGTRDMDSTPAQTYASPAPIAIEPAAVCTACIDEPQKRLMVDPATVRGSPASTPTSRAGVHALLALREGAAER